jgi:hypothetical protein
VTLSISHKGYGEIRWLSLIEKKWSPEPMFQARLPGRIVVCRYADPTDLHQPYWGQVRL